MAIRLNFMHFGRSHTPTSRLVFLLSKLRVTTADPRDYMKSNIMVPGVYMKSNIMVPGVY